MLCIMLAAATPIHASVPRTPNPQPSCTSNPLSSISSTTAQPSSVTAQPIPPYVWDVTPNPQPSCTPNPLSSITAQPIPPYVWDVTVSDHNEEFTVPYTPPSWEQAKQSPLNALPQCEHRPLLRGANDTSKGTAT